MKSVSAFVALGAVLATLSPGALAQTTPGDTAIQVEQFDPATAQGVNILNVRSSEVVPHLKPSAGLFLHYSENPLVLVRQDQPETVYRSVVGSQLKAELNASIGFFDVIDLGVAVPLVLTQSGDDLEDFGRAGTSIEGFALSDIRVIPKVQAVNWTDASGFGLAIALPFYIPTGDAETFNGYDDFRFFPQLILDYHHDVGFALVANVGYELRPKRRSQNIVSDDVLKWAVGVEIPTGSDIFSIVGSVFGSASFEDNVDPLDLTTPTDGSDSSPIEALMGLQFRLPAELVITAGGGLGLNKAIGAPEYRVFFSFSRSPSARDRDRDGIYDAVDDCPRDPEDIDGFEDDDGCPDVDNDQDGIRDVEDGCPMDKEDKDNFEDQDGCPEPDNDKDGLLDPDDKCPVEPEDHDNYKDQDGCPDPDNDGDGILDVDDKCPMQPEDKDGWDDDDGCPDPDNDSDGFADPDDKCPNEAETANGYQDDDGCPDTKPRKNIRVTKTKIEILEKVYFETAKAVIKERSFQLLLDVSAVMKENPQITKIQVEGHTDSRGPDKYNMKLSQARADSVREFLVESGQIDPDRLVSKGFGETSPKASNRSAKGRAENRRVEFTILEVNGKPVGPGPVIIEKKEEVEE